MSSDRAPKRVKVYSGPERRGQQRPAPEANAADSADFVAPAIAATTANKGNLAVWIVGILVFLAGCGIGSALLVLAFARNFFS